MLYNRENPTLPNQKNPHALLLFFFPSLSFYLLHHPCPPVPPSYKAAELSCCAACMFDLVFHWLSCCQGVCVWGTSSCTVFGWVSFSTPGPVLLSIIPSAEGSAHLTQWGSRLIPSPAQSVPSGVRIF